MNIVEGEIKGPALISWCGTEWRGGLTKDIVDREIRKHDKGGESMNKKLKAIALTLCLALSLVASVSAIEITEGDMITPSNPAHPYAPSPGDTADPNWTSGSDSTHQFITANAITIVKKAYPSYPLSSYTSTLKTASDYPDTSASGQTDNGTFIGHFYNPDTGRTWTGVTNPTAKARLIWWYNDAVSKYKAGNISTAMNSLGCALHYAADLSTPHHAANKVVGTSMHAEFENYARAHKNEYAVTSTTSNTFTWAKSTAIGDMGHNFAVNAKAVINTAEDGTKFPEATQQTLPKAQKNCAAVLYKFLVDVGKLS